MSDSAEVMQVAMGATPGDIYFHRGTISLGSSASGGGQIISVDDEFKNIVLHNIWSKIIAFSGNFCKNYHIENENKLIKIVNLII